jgi:hypothetical protein
MTAPMVFPRPIPGPCSVCGGEHPKLVIDETGAGYCVRCAAARCNGAATVLVRTGGDACTQQ